jgi:hypothetical protein
VRLVNDRAAISEHTGGKYYAQNGEMPHQLYYPGVDGVWPLHRHRLLWQWMFRRFDKPARYDHVSDEWRQGHHLPGIARTGGQTTRYSIAVRPNLSRIIYFYTSPSKTGAGRVKDRLLFELINNPLEYNFSSQDNGAASPCRYWTPEYLSPTDSQTVALRKLVVEHSRDAQRRRQQISQDAARGHDFQIGAVDANGVDAPVGVSGT